MEQPLISICIPTYNRSKILKENLDRLVSLKGFDNNVEIVISDNCSTDDTQLVGQHFSSQYSNIKYFRNEKNIKDANFPLALDRATGKYIKLQNDNNYFLEESILYLTDCVKKDNGRKIPFFFTNNFVFTNKKSEEIFCNSFDSYIQAISTYVTAISCFGAWKEHWDIVKDRLKYTDLKLNQVDWSFQILENLGACILYDKPYFWFMGVGKRSGYNWFQIHLDNYYCIMNPYINKGLISKETYENDKKNLLKHFKPELVNIYCTIPFFKKKNWKYDTKNTFWYFWKYYKNNYYFYLLIIIWPFYSLFKLILDFLRFIKHSILK